MRRLLPLLLLAASLTACANHPTPEGHEGYVQHIPLIFGRGGFLAAQTGPTSTGMVWRQYVTNVDIRAKNYTEEFHILSRDNLNVGFHAHARIAIRSGSIRELVERYGGGPPTPDSLPRWYERAVRQPYRTAVRDVVHQYDAYDIQARTQEIGIQVMESLQQQYEDTPIEFLSMSIGNLAYPPAINAEIQRKLAAEQDLDRMERERQIAEQQAAILVTRARGLAAAQRIVNETLTPLYVQHEMLEGMQELSRSSRVTIIAAPTGDGAGSPVMLQVQ